MPAGCGAVWLLLLADNNRKSNSRRVVGRSGGFAIDVVDRAGWLQGGSHNVVQLHGGGTFAFMQDGHFLEANKNRGLCLNQRPF